MKPAFKEKMTNDIDLAKTNWQATMRHARSSAKSGNWAFAVMLFKFGLDLSEIILFNENTEQAQDQYLQNAIELTHALRNSDHSNETDEDARKVYQFVSEQLEFCRAGSFDKKHLEPLAAVAFNELAKVNEWMAQWHKLFSHTKKKEG
ncbi:hypothetical protein [Salinibius halmophilus]|uniref:hypothetical protein n=1 Tax=Salinibius halmophilus TaxID=1853216 RepID=UPI000E675F45|nr:hypothetical protein [Salinibius halmophilus]